MGQKINRYAPEFRRQMVELHRAGRSFAELAAEFGCTSWSIRHWVKQAARNRGRGDGGLTSEELTQLRRENRKLLQERDTLPVRVMCRLLQVSASGFYAWQDRPMSARRRADIGLAARIHEIYRRSKGRYGSPNIHAELQDDHDVHVGRKRMARLMREEGLKSIVAPTYVVTTTPDGAAGGNDLPGDGAGCLEHGSCATATDERHSPFGPRLPIHELCVWQTLPGDERDAIHGHGG